MCSQAILEAPPVEMWLAIPLGGGAYYPLGSGIAAIINAVQIQVRVTTRTRRPVGPYDITTSHPGRFLKSKSGSEELERLVAIDHGEIAGCD